MADINIETDPIFSRLSPTSIIKYPLDIVNEFGKNEQARTLLSYAAGGLVTHPTTRTQIMMENANDALEHAEGQYEMQFDAILLESIENVLRQKYSMTTYKKALLATGDKIIKNAEDVQSFAGSKSEAFRHAISQIMMALRTEFRRKEAEKMTQRSQFLQRIQNKWFVISVYERLYDLITTGQNDLSSFLGKSLNQIVKMLGVPDIKLTNKQKSVIDRMDASHLKPVNEPRIRHSDDRRGLDHINQNWPVTYIPTVNVQNVGQLGLETGNIYAFLLKQPLSYQTNDGRRMELAPRTKFICSIGRFDNQQTALIVSPIGATTPTGGHPDLPSQMILPLSSIAQKSFDAESIIPGETFARESNDDVIDVGTAFPGEFQHMEFILSLPYTQDDVSIIPFLLRILYAQQYNRQKRGYEIQETTIQMNLCKAVLKRMLKLKNLILRSEDFEQKRKDFCKFMTPEIGRQYLDQWTKKNGIFANMSADEATDLERVLHENTLFNEDENNRIVKTDQNIHKLFVQKYFNKTNTINDVITFNDINNNSTGTMVVSSSEDVHSCKYVFMGNNSVISLVLKNVARKIVEPARRQQFKDLSRAMPGKQMVDIIREIKIHPINSITDAYEEHRRQGAAIINRRLIKATVNLYDVKNKQYLDVQRLLVTTSPRGLVGNHIFTAKLKELRSNLLATVNPLSQNELFELSKKDGKKGAAIVFSYQDKMWLQGHFLDILEALNFFKKYLVKKGISGVLDVKHTQFIVNLFAKCLDKSAGEIEYVDDDDIRIPDDIKELNYLKLGNTEMRKIWSYMLSLYNARILLRSKLAKAGLKFEDNEKIEKFSLEVARETIKNTKNVIFSEGSRSVYQQPKQPHSDQPRTLLPSSYKKPEIRTEMRPGRISDEKERNSLTYPNVCLFNTIGLAVVNIVKRLKGFLKSVKGKYLEIGASDMVFVYQILTRRDDSLGQRFYEDEDNHGLIAEFLQRSLNQDQYVDSEIGIIAENTNRIMYQIDHVLKNNMAVVSIEKRLCYFSNNEEVREIQKDESDDERDDIFDVSHDQDEREQPDDDQPDEADYSEMEEEDDVEDHEDLNDGWDE
uniref:Uncharacterized protein n=1 Tax=viral metagenome TaxID=1070528 RepID=A0A6C0KFR1_9ZZZZ